MFVETSEWTMATPLRKACASNTQPNGDGSFPPEAYAYDDDVTAEAVAMLRESVDGAFADEAWELIDGLGLSL